MANAQVIGIDWRCEAIAFEVSEGCAGESIRYERGIMVGCDREYCVLNCLRYAFALPSPLSIRYLRLVHLLHPPRLRRPIFAPDDYKRRHTEHCDNRPC